jgi:iron complex transport system permease protein
VVVEMSYAEYIKEKYTFGSILLFLLILASLVSLCTGSYSLTPSEVLNTLMGAGDRYANIVVWNMRLPRIAASIIAGLSLAVAGAVMQCVLRNPLASPFTIGISHGAAFGAAFAIIVLGAGELHRVGEGVIITNPYLIPVFAFLGALLGVFVILLLARLRGLSPEAMILAGVAMASLFSAATMLMQYFAEDVKVAAVVFWTFGDIGRANWREIQLMIAAVIPALVYFIYRRWDYNALISGDETAISLGINPEKVRLESMLLASLITAICVSFLGIIGFIGLVSPHIVRLVAGGDHRFLIPLSSLLGSLLLLSADTVGRTIIAPVVIPVGIVTSFMGAPVFIYLLVRGSGR